MSRKANKVTYKARGANPRQARMEAHGEPGNANPWRPIGPGAPMSGHMTSATTGQKPQSHANQQAGNNIRDMGMGPGFTSEPGRKTNPMSGQAKDASIGPTKNQTQVEVSRKNQPGTMGKGGRGAPFT